ncbi:hypothetical protein DKG34_33295 [Streptomyces sp. NWU49]|nr:hypothetical protein DKG34_33295 [Streptomyces sp. NWU49]
MARRPERRGVSRSRKVEGERAQQPEQQQLQRARAAPRDPAGRVEVSAKFASMPIRTPVHTSTVNTTPGMWDMFHLIRFISRVKGLLRRFPGHMVRTAGRTGRRCDPVIGL